MRKSFFAPVIRKPPENPTNPVNWRPKPPNKIASINDFNGNQATTWYNQDSNLHMTQPHVPPSSRQRVSNIQTKQRPEPKKTTHDLATKDGNSTNNAQLLGDDDDYKTSRMPSYQKPRVAHKPTIASQAQTNSSRPRYPIGISKKVPIVIRQKYLDIIINEMLNAGCKSDEEYFKEALEEEKKIAERASSKMIYLNLIAALKKKIRDGSGVSIIQANLNPKEKQSLSHEEILAGRVVGTCSIEKRKRVCRNPSELSKEDLYQKLCKYILPEDQLVHHGYPYSDPDNPTQIIIPTRRDALLKPVKSDNVSSYTCERCQTIYKVDEKRIPLESGKCIYHPGHLWNQRVNRSIERRYSCCKGDQLAGGCYSNKYHVQKGEYESENFTGYVKTRLKPDRDPDKHGVYALDCEMCYTTLGLELTRITVIDSSFEVVYEKLVKPKNFVLDYNSQFSGINEGDLDDVKTTLQDVQRDLLSLFSSKSILVGHGLDSDMKALKLIHGTFIDTTYLFPHKRGLPFKRALRTLMQEYLQIIIQDGMGHDSKEDAVASLKLVYWKLKTDA